MKGMIFMKRLTSVLLALTLALSLAACGSAPDQGSGAPSSTPEASTPVSTPEPSQPDEPQETPPAESDTPSEDDTDSEGGKTLVAYFSWSGNTETLAGMIQTETGGDLFAIEPETPYTDDYNTLLDVAQEEQSSNARPALAAEVGNWADYDTVFVGYPNWWGDAPMLVLSFLESYDCAGKTIVPFATSASGGFGRSIDSVTASAAGATVLEGFHVVGDSVEGASEDVAAWIAGLGLGQ